MTQLNLQDFRLSNRLIGVALWLVACGTLAAQSSLMLGSGSGTPGATTALNLTITSVAGSEPAALQWTLGYSTGVAAISVVAGSALATANKTMTCVPTQGGQTCVAFGLTANTISNGTVATVFVTTTSSATTAPVTLTNVIGATMAGMSIPTSVTSGMVATTAGPSTLGLIGYWNFDEGAGTLAHDISGNGHNGTVNRATWTTGFLNTALTFPGDANVVTGNVGLGNTFSVSVWVNPSVATVQGYVRILETQYAAGLYLGANAYSTKYKFIVHGGIGSTGACGASYGCAEGGTITRGWHLLTATYDGSIAILYVDGARVASDTFTAPGNTTFPLYMGTSYTGGYPWVGGLDEVRLYNRALTSTEVATIASTTVTSADTANLRTAAVDNFSTTRLRAAPNQREAPATSAATIGSAIQVGTLSCPPGSVGSGDKVICEVSLNQAASGNGTTILLSSDTDNVRVPLSAGVRGGQRRVRFRVETVPVTSQTTADISARIGDSTVHTNLTLLPVTGPLVTISGKRTARPGGRIDLTVTALDSNDRPLAATALSVPTGSLFDTATGVFVWQPTKTDMGGRSVTFTSTGLTGATTTTTISLNVEDTLPQITRLENGADEAAPAVCSSGSVASVTGHSLYQGEVPVGDDSGAATELNGTSVLVGGIPVAVLYGSAERVSFLCPVLPAGFALDVAVRTAAGISNTMPGSVAETAPAIFTNATGNNAVMAAVDSEELSQLPSFDQSGLPVLPGMPLVVLATGIPCDSLSLSRVFLKIGQQGVSVQSLHMDDKFAGVCRLSANAPNVVGDDVPVAIEVVTNDGHLAVSNVATVAIASRN